MASAVNPSIRPASGCEASLGVSGLLSDPNTKAVFPDKGSLFQAFQQHARNQLEIFFSPETRTYYECLAGLIEKQTLNCAQLSGKIKEAVILTVGQGDADVASKALDTEKGKKTVKDIVYFVEESNLLAVFLQFENSPPQEQTDSKTPRVEPYWLWD